MKMTMTRNVRARTTNGRRAFAAIALAPLLAIGVASGALSMVGGGDGTADETADGAMADDVSTRHRDMADCLWPVARNHGFYAVQHDALATGADPGGHALWLAFLDSIGADACGYEALDLEPLTTALRDTREAAARHFTAAR